MTSPFQTELRARATAHAREWADGRDPSVGLIEVEATVRRRRRGQALLAGAGSVALVGLVTSVALAGLGRGGATDPVATGDEPAPSALSALAAVGPTDVVVTMYDELPNPSGFDEPYHVVIFDNEGHQEAKIASADLSVVLGQIPNQWPTVTLVAIDPGLSRAIFVLDNPTAYSTPQVAMLSLDTGDVVMADPCGSTLNSIDLSPWCTSQPTVGSAIVIDPETGRAIQMPGYQACSGASARLADNVVATCEASPGESYLVTVDPSTGEVVAQTPLGMSPMQQLLVVDGSVYVNAYSTEGDPIMLDSDGNSSQVGGAVVAGLAVVGDRLLVQTEIDKFGDSSTYGKSIGLWSPSTGEFTKIYKLSDAEASSVTVVPVTR